MRRWLFGNWGLKLGAVLLGGGMWFYAVTEHSFEREIDIPLVVSDPANPTGGSPLVLASTPPPTVRVLVFGVGKDLLGMSASDLVLRVEPRARVPGNRAIRLSPAQVVNHSEYEVHIERVVEPQELIIAIDRRAERTRARPAPGRPSPGRRLHPGGRRPRLPRLGCAWSAPRPRCGRWRPSRPTPSIWKRCAPTSTWRWRSGRRRRPLIRLSTGEVRVTADVQELAEYEIQEVPVAVVGGPPGAGARPGRVTVRVRGGADLIGALDPETDFGLFVEYRGPEAGGLEIGAPAGRLYEVRQITPAHAEVLLR